jgi:hypothetical protein
VLEVVRVVEAGGRLEEDVAEQAALLGRQRRQHLRIVGRQLRAGLGDERRPGAVDDAVFDTAARAAEVQPPLVRHLQEQQVGDLLDVVTVVDPVVAQGVAEAPEFLDDVAHTAMPRWIEGPGPEGPRSVERLFNGCVW